MEHPERYKEHRHKYGVSEKGRKKYREYAREFRKDGRYKEWQNSNKNKTNEYNQKHRNHDITDEEWIACKTYFNNSCAYCELHIDDHYIIFAGKMKHTDLHREHVDDKGENDLSNCVPSCRNCNSSKHTSELDDWYNDESNINYTENRYEKIFKWLTEDYKKYIDN